MGKRLGWAGGVRGSQRTARPNCAGRLEQVLDMRLGWVQRCICIWRGAIRDFEKETVHALKVAAVSQFPSVGSRRLECFHGAEWAVKNGRCHEPMTALHAWLSLGSSVKDVRVPRPLS